MVSPVLARTLSSSFADLSAAAANSGAAQPAASSQASAPSPILDAQMIERFIEGGSQSPERIRSVVKVSFFEAIRRGNPGAVAALFGRAEVAPSPSSVETAKTQAALLKGKSLGNLDEYAEIPFAQAVQLSRQKAMRDILKFLEEQVRSQGRASTPPARISHAPFSASLSAQAKS